MVLFDANTLVALTSPKTSEDDLARLTGLLEELKKKRDWVGIPTPAMAEYLIRTDEASAAALQLFERKQFVRILPFDRKAAIQCSLLHRAALSSGDKRGAANKSAPWQKVKIDWQILAIALANNADSIITADDDLHRMALGRAIQAFKIEELQLPESARQVPLHLVPRDGGQIEVNKAAALPGPAAQAPPP